YRRSSRLLSGYTVEPMPSGTLVQLPEWASGLLEDARVGHLALLDATGQPPGVAGDLRNLRRSSLDSHRSHAQTSTASPRARARPNPKSQFHRLPDTARYRRSALSYFGSISRWRRVGSRRGG